MNKIFNYKASASKPNFKMYYLLWNALIIAFLLLILLKLFGVNGIEIILFLLVICMIALIAITIKIIAKWADSNVYVLNETSNEFYKIGIYPNKVGALPRDDEFMIDKHFFQTYRSNFLKGMVQSARVLKGHVISVLETLGKLNDKNYVLRQLVKENHRSIVYKINNIYSYEFLEELNSYCIICDVFEIYQKKEYKNIKLYINRNFDQNNEILNYIQKVCLR